MGHDGLVTPRELRQFGLTLAALVAIFFGFLVPWRFGWTPPRWPWGLAGLLAVAAIAAPYLLRSLHRAWTLFGYALAWLNVRLLLGAAFYVAVTPLGLLLRLTGHDLLSLRPRREAASYRIASAQYAPADMRRPF